MRLHFTINKYTCSRIKLADALYLFLAIKVRSKTRNYISRIIKVYALISRFQVRYNYCGLLRS